MPTQNKMKSETEFDTRCSVKVYPSPDKHWASQVAQW